MISKKKDYYLVAIIGFLVGWLVLLPAKNIGLGISPIFISASVLGLTVFAPVALFILKRLSQIWPIFEQFGKFAAVGTLNTFLDLGILNLLMLVTGIYSGLFFTGFKAISFIVGTTNSYFWNKFWTFGSKLPVTISEYARFGAFTLVGIAINVTVASLVVNIIGIPSGIDPRIWANIGAIIAVFSAMFWNFLTYKKIVFKEN